MNDTTGSAAEFISLIDVCATASENLPSGAYIKFNIIFSLPADGAPKKQKARLCKSGENFIMSFEEEYDFGRVAQRNIPLSRLGEEVRSLIPSYSQVNLIFNASDAQFKRSKRGKESFFGKKSVLCEIGKLSASAENATDISEVTPVGNCMSLDRHKKYALTGEEEFLYHLGISDKSGRVHDKKQAKFRQINRFAQELENIEYALPRDGKIIIYDLCCGKSYLSFAVYYYYTKIKKRDVSMLCIDRRSDVIDYCADIARLSGFDGMRFVCDDVRNTPRGERPNLVISLHACDIATDIVINRAIALSCDVILSTPCCHRYMNDKINNTELGFVLKHPHLRNKLCEVFTDAVRAARLSANGYSVSVCELTDPENTPKNTLIRAVRNKNFKKSSESAKKLSEKYENILHYLFGDLSSDYLAEIEDMKK